MNAPRGAPVDPEKQDRFSDCVAKATQTPWQVAEARVNGRGFAVAVQALTDDLQLPYRAGSSQQQRYVTVGFSRFTDYLVIDPRRIPMLLADGDFTRLQELKGVATSTLKPFDVYDNGNGSIALINAAGKEYCYAHPTPEDWPNPFMKCQVVRADYYALVTFSTEAILETPKLLSRVRDLFIDLQPCFETI